MSSDLAKEPRPLDASRLDIIDVLRGLACLWVTYCHAHGTWGNLANAAGPLKLITQFVGIGGKGVDLFVVISGFCLFYPVLKRTKEGRPQHSIIEFYRRRLNRICPVYFSAIVFALAVAGLGFHIADNRGILDLWPYILFIQNMMPAYIARINGPLWSVALEMQLYALFPLFALAIKKRKFASLFIGLAILSILSSVADSQRWFDQSVFDPFKTHALPSRAIEFVLGMGAASICVNEHRRLRYWLYLISPIALLVGLIAVSKSMQNNPFHHLGSVAWGLVGAAVVVGSIQLHTHHGRVPAILTPLKRIGLMSFSIYVVHFPIMLAMQPVMASSIHNPIQAILIYTVTGLPITLALGFLLFLFVERYTLNVKTSPAPRASAMRIDRPVASNLGRPLLAEAAV